MAPGAVKLRPRRSQEVRGSLEFQNGGPRALNEAWMITFWFLRQKQAQEGTQAHYYRVGEWSGWVVFELVTLEKLEHQ